MILTREAEANIALNKARELDKLGRAFVKNSASDIILRDALKEYITAYWVFKQRRKELSTVMHAIGRLLHDRFGCQIKFNESGYYRDCPVWLSHINLGCSVPCSESYICSICGKDPIECDHTIEETYDHVKCQVILNVCNICLSRKGSFEHIPGHFYDNVKQIYIVTDIEEVYHVALVSNPADPLCRIEAVLVFKQDIESMLKKAPSDFRRTFEYGKTQLYCNHCVQCSNFE